MPHVPFICSYWLFCFSIFFVLERFFCLFLDFMSVFFFFLVCFLILCRFSFSFLSVSWFYVGFLCFRVFSLYLAGMRAFVARGPLAARGNESRNGKDGRTTSPGGQVDPTHTLWHTPNLTPHTRSLPLVVWRTWLSQMALDAQGPSPLSTKCDHF